MKLRSFSRESPLEPPRLGVAAAERSNSSMTLYIILCRGRAEFKSRIFNGLILIISTVEPLYKDITEHLYKQDSFICSNLCT